MDKKIFDVIVAGGGPAGIMAARNVARGGRSVCLIDRKEHIGLPVRCGEGIGIKGFEKSSSVNPEWIKSTITKLKLVAPSGIAVTLPAGFDGYIVSRERMERDMTNDAISAGAIFVPDTTVLHAFRNGNMLYECTTTRGTYHGRILIIADGVESKLARCFGWRTSLKLRDMHSCAFAGVSGINVETDTCVLLLGKNLAPGGYVWIFPKGNACANVGLGVNGFYSTAGKARDLLMQFITTRFPGAHVRDLHCGGVPMSTWLHPLARDGVMIIGDAARQMNCATGAGINYALLTGQIAGRVAAESISGDACNYDHLQLYQKEWGKHYGKQQVRSYALKEALIKFSDNFINSVATSVVSQKNKQFSVVKVFLQAFSSHPVLMYKAFRLFK